MTGQLDWKTVHCVQIKIVRSKTGPKKWSKQCCNKGPWTQVLLILQQTWHLRSSASNCSLLYAEKYGSMTSRWCRVLAPILPLSRFISMFLILIKPSLGFWSLGMCSGKSRFFFTSIWMYFARSSMCRTRRLATTLLSSWYWSRPSRRCVTPNGKSLLYIAGFPKWAGSEPPPSKVPFKGAWRVPPRGGHEGEKGLKPPWSPSQAPLKPPSPWSPLQALLKPPWSPSQAPLKPPSSPPEALLKPPWSPSQAPLKPPWTGLKPRKPPSSPSVAPIQPPGSPSKPFPKGSFM